MAETAPIEPGATATGRLEVARVVGVLELGGAQLSLLRLAAALRSHGVQTRLYAGGATAAGVALAEEFGVPVEVFGTGGGWQWVPSHDFADWLRPRLRGADLVHGHMVGGWWAAARAAPPDVPLVASEHNAVSWPHGDHSAQAREAVGRVSAFFAHGPAARAFAEAIGVPAERLHEGRSPVGGTDATAVPGLPEPRITFAGRLHAEKGPDVLVDALALMPDPPTTFLLGDGPLASSLAARVSALGLGDRVRMPGWVAAPGTYVAGAAVHVVPSREEAWSQSAVMALGLGVPVVGCAVEGLPTTLGEGRGILVPADDPAALAEAVDLVLRGRLVTDTEGGRRYARQYSSELVADSYARTYRYLLSPA